MTVHVRLFAVVRQWAGAPALDVEVPGTGTVGDVRRAMLARMPQLQRFGGHLRFAVNSDYADDATPIGADSEIACIPPPSGG
jgi:molybdopterin converting factor small subunit